MPIDPAALAASIGELHDLDLERGLTVTLQQVVLAATSLFGADGAGLMLADANGELRWASASDQQSQLVEEDQERLRTGAVPGGVLPADGHHGPGRRHRGRSRWFPYGPSQCGVPGRDERAGGAIGSLDLYSARPRDWDDSEVSALRAYAGIEANLLGSAAAAHLKGRLADQLQAALAHGAVIEQAKGVLMEREGLDAATAYEQLRAAARPSSRKVVDVARQLLAGVPLPPNEPMGRQQPNTRTRR